MRVFETGQPMLGLAVKAETPAEPGHIREFIVDFYPVKDGQHVFAIGNCVREVTVERELERQIAESAVRQRIAVASAGLGVFEWYMTDDRMIWENERLYEIFGRDPDRGPIRSDELGRGVMHPDDAARFGEALERAAQTAQFHTTVRIYRQNDGALRHIEYFGSLEAGPDGNPDRMIGVIADVTERQEALARERQEQDRLQRLQDSLSAFVGMLAPDGTLIEINVAALGRTLGRKDVIGKKFWDCWWWSYSEESQTTLRDAVARAAAGERLRYDTEARMANGEMITLDFQLVPIFGADGRVIEIVPSAVDVTERVRAERHKDVLLAELEHRVKNTLATVQAIARFTARLSRNKESMAEGLVNRLAALSRSHDALDRKPLGRAAAEVGRRLRSLGLCHAGKRAVHLHRRQCVPRSKARDVGGAGAARACDERGKVRGLLVGRRAGRVRGGMRRGRSGEARVARNRRTGSFATCSRRLWYISDPDPARARVER